MAKAVISNRIYIEVDRDMSDKIKKELTYSVPNYADPTKPIRLQNYATFRTNILSIPVGRTDLIPKNYEIIDRRVLASESFPEFKFTLRDSQQAIHDAVNDNALINAKVSWGKTFTGAAIAGKLGQKTLVVVHTLPLMNQWAKEIKKVYDFTPGLIGNGHENWDAPITIGNVASLYKRMDRLQKEFGTLIMDEVHHAPSPTFEKVVDRCYARYKIGLSGTLERKDGKHVVIPDYFSRNIFKPPVENRMEPEVHAINTGLIFPNGGSWAERINILKNSEEYQSLVATIASSYEQQGHTVLVVSDRVEFLKSIAARTGFALVIGDTKERDAEFTKLDDGETGGICGTQSIFCEGISHDPLSVIILATPINNLPLLEQLCGRIQRLCPDKPQPVVVDLLLRGWTTEKQFTNRQGFYMKQGWKIKYL
jgi:superfamily II DNA or RNA helicase